MRFIAAAEQLPIALGGGVSVLTGIHKINGYLNDGVTTTSLTDSRVNSPNTYGQYPTDALDCTWVWDRSERCKRPGKMGSE